MNGLILIIFYKLSVILILLQFAHELLNKLNEQIDKSHLHVLLFLINELVKYFPLAKVKKKFFLIITINKPNELKKF